MDEWIVYILLCMDGRIHVGCTNNIEERMVRHGRGEIHATKSNLPVKLALTVTFYDKYKAYKFEKYLKSGSGRSFLQRHFL